MKRIFIEGRYKGKIILPKLKLESPIGLFTAVQFIGNQDSMASQIEKQGLKAKTYKPGHAKYNGQVLGCSVEQFAGVKSILYVGDGRFHPLALAFKNNIPVHCYNPFTKKMSLIGNEELSIFKKLKEKAIKRFLMSDSVGILVSTKEGQSRLKHAIELKKKLEQSKKKAYVLLADELNLQGLENFPFIQCFVNTACPRISYDDYQKSSKPIVELEDIIEYI
jgi:2-(3-amino-3-carboxypropyl)histidine synthase